MGSLIFAYLPQKLLMHSAKHGAKAMRIAGSPWPDEQKRWRD
jgi:hypothetical protein